MERQNPDSSRGFGRGRPMEDSRLRRPFTTYATDVEYVPAEGSNLLRLSVGDAPRHDISPNGESGIYLVPSGDHAHPANIHNSSPNNRVIPEMKSVLSPYAKEFVPRNFHPEPRVVPPAINTSIDTSSDSYSIQELRNFLYEITLNPGMFENKIQPLIDCLNDYVDDADTLRAIVNIIFDESVRQPNFRYNGARLCKYLCSELNATSDRLNFKQLLLLRCSQEHKRRDHLALSDDGGAYLRGFAMYLAELFSQLEIPNQRIPMLGENLTSVIETLLAHPSCDNLKCICQILKLVGVYLEDMERNKVPNNRTAVEMEKIINSLKLVSENQDFPRDIRIMVSNVVELRASDWGRASDNDPVIEEHPTSIPLNEPVMYGPDGKPITAEESQFLHSQYYHTSDADEYDAYDENVDEMGDEIQAAYEVFLNEIAH